MTDVKIFLPSLLFQMRKIARRSREKGSHRLPFETVSSFEYSVYNAAGESRQRLQHQPIPIRGAHQNKFFTLSQNSPLILDAIAVDGEIISFP